MGGVTISAAEFEAGRHRVKPGDVVGCPNPQCGAPHVARLAGKSRYMNENDVVVDCDVDLCAWTVDVEGEE